MALCLVGLGPPVVFLKNVPEEFQTMGELIHSQWNCSLALPAETGYQALAHSSARAALLLEGPVQNNFIIELSFTDVNDVEAQPNYSKFLPVTSSLLKEK